MTMDSAIISAIISLIVSSIVSLYVLRRTSFNAEVARLNQNMMDIIKISIEYPYLESDNYCKSWPPKSETDESLRYENYCCILFNFMEQIYKLYDGDKNKISDFFATKEMIIRHRNWWQNPSGLLQNIQGYCHGFQDYVRSFIT